MDDFIAVKHFDDGNSAWVIQLTFNRGRIIYGPTSADWLLDNW